MELIRFVPEPEGFRRGRSPSRGDIEPSGACPAKRVLRRAASWPKSPASARFGVVLRSSRPGVLFSGAGELALSIAAREPGTTAGAGWYGDFDWCGDFGWWCCPPSCPLSARTKSATALTGAGDRVARHGDHETGVESARPGVEPERFAAHLGDA